MLLHVLFTMGLAHAGFNVNDVVAIDAPRGARVVSVPEREEPYTPSDLVSAFVADAPSFGFRRSFVKIGQPIDEPSLAWTFRTETDQNMIRFVKLAVELMRARGIHLAPEHGTPVRYRGDSTEIEGRTTTGLTDACWDCYGGTGGREAVASSLGLEVGRLTGKMSFNPRFGARQLYRGSAAVYHVTFTTRERGTVDVPITYLMTESYLPFVADLPTTGLGQRVYGVGQHLRITARAALNPLIFGLAKIDFTPVDVFNSWRGEVPSGRMDWTFEEIRDHAVADHPRPRYVWSAIRAIANATNAFALSRDPVTLPGSPSWIFSWLE